MARSNGTGHANDPIMRARALALCGGFAAAFCGGLAVCVGFFRPWYPAWQETGYFSGYAIVTAMLNAGGVRLALAQLGLQTVSDILTTPIFGVGICAVAAYGLFNARRWSHASVAGNVGFIGHALPWALVAAPAVWQANTLLLMLAGALDPARGLGWGLVLTACGCWLASAGGALAALVLGSNVAGAHVSN